MINTYKMFSYNLNCVINKINLILKINFIFWTIDGSKMATIKLILSFFIRVWQKHKKIGLILLKFQIYPNLKFYNKRSISNRSKITLKYKSNKK